MFIHDIADFLVNLTCKDIKPDIYSVFDSPSENNCPNNVNREKLTILEILNAIGCRLKNLFGFVKINTTTETSDEGEAVVNVNGDVDNLNFDFKIPRGKPGPQGPAGPGVATGGTTGQVLAKKSNTNYDTEWINNSGGGSTVSVNVGETTTGEPGTNASVTNSGDETNVVLDFTIPRGKTGPQGPQGEPGADGKTGPQGPAGPGVAAGGTTGQVLAKKSNTNYDTEWINNSGGGSTVSVNVGETTTGEPGTNASVTNSGDETNVVLDFTIPRGKTGPQGPQGEPGADGKTGPQGPAGPGVATGGTTGQVLAKKSNANFDTEWINNSGGGSTVSVNVGETTTGEPGTNASVTNSGDETNVVLDFTIPRGKTGPQGPQGEPGADGKTGPQGPAGPGVATGGTTGQVLAKKSNANFDTEWINPLPYVPIGGIIEWDGTGLNGAPDLSTPEKVASVYGYGTWERYGIDRVTVGAGGEYSVGSTGGEATHTLTVAELPKDIGHFNAISWATNNIFTGGAFTVKQIHKDRTMSNGSDVGDALFTLSGEGTAHNNMQPYIGTFKYRRIA
jgi:mannose-6-phosphate isomerase-like protein (cupin superfamily)